MEQDVNGASDFLPIKKIKIFCSLGEEHATHAHHSDRNIQENLVAKLLKYVEWATWDCGCYNIGNIREGLICDRIGIGLHC
ncbi:hypothetical protein RchiOBHm_Chr2g0166471 [Rosa chinensis]|uniref:Uncharacterized protein n=1 Tax=Rosa chinensis TaxID=74649 RepID=A0A2P6S441_ROSCH|nr:hypothetical protein RchiOBHm_Chr2g0166471 [Rosa chinensis]